MVLLNGDVGGKSGWLAENCRLDYKKRKISGQSLLLAIKGPNASLAPVGCGKPPEGAIFQENSRRQTVLMN
ncbi:hypothetical protein ACLIKD_10515 [Azonexus sp. IMCC34842]|uniref:hypothetical protein n=1 Tax=Azonexus sp. IMCC34842 TaxID=3420950 RepID=UPI003D09E222